MTSNFTNVKNFQQRPNNRYQVESQTSIKNKRIKCSNNIKRKNHSEKNNLGLSK